MSGTFDRDGAFSIELEGGEEGGPHKLLTLDGRLYVFSPGKICRVRTADDIDPDRTALETRHAYQELYSAGYNNSFVARSVIQAKQILDGVVLKPGLTKIAVLDAIWEATQFLLQCENSHYRIYNDVMNLIKQVDDVVENSKQRAAIPSLPQVEDLDDRVASFLGGAKRFLEKAHFLLAVFYDAPQQGSNFKAYRDWMSANRSNSTKVVELLRGDREWIRFLAESRNALGVNHSRANFVMEVQNFALQPGNKILPPSWRYDLSERGGPTQQYWSDIVTDMHTHLSNMLTFLEELYILCVLDNLDEQLPFKFGIGRLPSDQVSDECPIVYVARASRRNQQA